MEEEGLASTLVQWIPDIGASGLLALVIFLIFTGKLVPGKEVRYWREAFFEEQRQKRQLLDEVGGTTQEVLRAIPEAIREKDS